MIQFIYLTLSLIPGSDFYPGTSDQLVELATQSLKLTYSAEDETNYSFQLASNLGHLGLLDITKLNPKQEIESLKIKYAEIPSTTFKGQIVLVDANRNGKFEYDSTDLFGLTSFSEQIRFENINFSRSKQPISLKIAGQTYELQFDEDGSAIRLAKAEADHNNSLTFPYRIPAIEVRAFTKNARLNKSNGKYTYVEFWGTWCKPCIQIIPEIQSLKAAYGDKLNIVSVDYQDNNLERVKEYIVKYKMSWDHLIANKALMREFATPYFPCGVLFDPDGNLVEYGISPDRVGEVIEARN